MGGGGGSRPYPGGGLGSPRRPYPPAGLRGRRPTGDSWRTLRGDGERENDTDRLSGGGVRGYTVGGGLSRSAETGQDTIHFRIPVSGVLKS